MLVCGGTVRNASGKQARRTTRKDIRPILRLTHEQGQSVRAVSERLKISKTSAATYPLRAKETGLSVGRYLQVSMTMPRSSDIFSGALTATGSGRAGLAASFRPTESQRRDPDAALAGEQDSDALSAHLVNHCQQIGGLAHAEYRGWFVKDQHLRPEMHARAMATLWRSPLATASESATRSIPSNSAPSFRKKHWSPKTVLPAPALMARCMSCRTAEL